MTPSGGFFMDYWLLALAVACAIPYGSVIALLLWSNPRNKQAWYIAGGAILAWPFLFFMSAMQLVVVVPLVVIILVNGRDISKPLTPRAIYWALATTIAFLALVGCIALIHDSINAAQ